MPKKIALGFILVTTALVVPALAGPVTIGGLWYEFEPSYPSTAVGLCTVCTPSTGGNSVYANAAPWTFNASAGGVFFTLTDAFLHGDSFDIHDFYNSTSLTIFASNSTLADGSGCGSDPSICILDPGASHAIIALAAGTHSISIFSDHSLGLSANDGAYFRVDAATAAPEPATLLLFGVGLAGLLLWASATSSGEPGTSRSLRSGPHPPSC